MKLYSYWRSTTSYRVRIALNLKGCAYDTVPIDLVAGDQRSPEYKAINPSGGVPSLVLDDGNTVLTQSMAILEYLEAAYSSPSIIPTDPIVAANVRAAANVIACDIHPVNNLKVVSALKDLGHSQDEGVAWMNDWMAKGLKAYQELLPPEGLYSFGDKPTFADICLIPQLYNAHRWGTDLSELTRLTDIERRCLDLPAFVAAHPNNQPDSNSRI